jgi:hypothetical protein
LAAAPPRISPWHRPHLEHRPEPVPPHLHDLVADDDAALEKQVLDVPQRQREPHYIMTTRRITSGEELKQRNGLAGLRGRGMGIR